MWGARLDREVARYESKTRPSRQDVKASSSRRGRMVNGMGRTNAAEADDQYHNENI